MMQNKFLAFGAIIIFVAIYISCSKSGTTPTPAPTCSGVTINVTGIVGNTTSGLNNGSITASASGSSGFTFNLNGGIFQPSGIFTNLSAGLYTIVAKNSSGCTGSAQFTVGAGSTACSGTAGPLFTAVRAVVRNNCALSGCHLSPNPQSGIDFSSDCVIISQKDRIKLRAVDGNPSIMPPPPNPALSAADKQKITDWIAAGGLYSN